MKINTGTRTKKIPLVPVRPQAHDLAKEIEAQKKRNYEFREFYTYLGAEAKKLFKKHFMEQMNLKGDDSFKNRLSGRTNVSPQDMDVLNKYKYENKILMPLGM